MNTYRFFGSLCLFAAGYLAHLTFNADWMLRGKIIIGVVIAFLIYIGLAGVLSKNKEEFRENVVNGLNLFSALP
jgi:cytosine/uracil/thiamine/allantoin permease